MNPTETVKRIETAVIHLDKNHSVKEYQDSLYGVFREAILLGGKLKTMREIEDYLAQMGF